MPLTIPTPEMESRNQAICLESAVLSRLSVAAAGVMVVPPDMERKLEEVMLNFKDGFDMGTLPKYYYAVHLEYLQVGARERTACTAVVCRFRLGLSCCMQSVQDSNKGAVAVLRKWQVAVVRSADLMTRTVPSWVGLFAIRTTV